jgi:uncharacterized protein YqjF (DUF2071 family)
MTPDTAQRLALRESPVGRPVMRQRWSRLLFLHWPVDLAAIAARLPAGLHVDTFEGRAWLGIVPFFMERVRPVGLPPVPWLSWFLELNVRTYVHDDHGNAGVWFFSLDCNQPIAVEIARRFFHLPYEHATMTAEISDRRVLYRSRRKAPGAEDAMFDYEVPATTAPAELGSLEWFLVERYLLFSSNPAGEIFTGRVHHTPYRIAPGICPAHSTEPLRLDAFSVPSKPPASVLTADPVDVRIFPLRRGR